VRPGVKKYTFVSVQEAPEHPQNFVRMRIFYEEKQGVLKKAMD
jgi:hypothetical protein